MKKFLSTLFKIILPVGLGIYLVIFIFNSLSESEKKHLYQALSSADYMWVWISVLFGIISHFFRAYRWKYQLNALGYSPKVYNNFMAVMTGYIVNMALPRVGEATRAAMLTRYEGVPFQKGFGSILAERTIDLVILIIITITTIFLQFEILKDFADALLQKGIDIFSTGNLIFLLCLLVGLAITIYMMWRLMRNTAFVSRGINFLKGLGEGLKSIFSMRHKGRYLLLSIGIWVMYLAMFYIAFYSLEATSDLHIGAIFASFVMGSFAIVLVPGGIGAYPAGIMQSLMLYGIAKETGLALGWIIWISQTAMLLVLGGLSLLLMPMINKPKTNASVNSVIEQNTV